MNWWWWYINDNNLQKITISTVVVARKWNMKRSRGKNRHIVTFNLSMRAGCHNVTIWQTIDKNFCQKFFFLNQVQMWVGEKCIFVENKSEIITESSTNLSYVPYDFKNIFSDQVVQCIISIYLCLKNIVLSDKSLTYVESDCVFAVFLQNYL